MFLPCTCSHSRHTLEMRREEIDVTSSYRPDTRWQYIDSEGHLHCWYEESESGTLVPAGEYDPAKEYSTPTLQYVLIAEETDEYPEEGHYVCAQCGEHVRIGYTADDIERYILGAISYYCDGRQIGKEEFDRLMQEEIGK